MVDMIAAAHLEIDLETYSTAWLNDIVFSQAQRLGYSRYFLNSPRAIENDHAPFLRMGVPAIDVIDLDYGPLNLYWHSRLHIPDKCSRIGLGV